MVRPSSGGGQDGGAERRRSRGAKMRVRESVNEVEEGSWMCCGNNKGHGRAGAVAGNGGATWWGRGKPAKVRQAAGGRAGGPGGGVRAARGSWQRGESPARGGGRWSRAAERKGREEDDGDLFKIFQKFKGFTVKLDFPFKP
jgi:hypothetical protein